MNTAPKWLSERYEPGGGGSGRGFLRNLDATRLDPLTLLVRESAQNSWDARLGDGPVHHRIELRTLTPGEAPVWRKLLSENAPTTQHLGLRTALDRSVLKILTVTDSGTKGLGGPTRADVVSEGDCDFVNFVRNTGSTADTESRGGTYGFGKIAFHLVSGPHTVLVHTRCRVEGRLETRLIGWALDEGYSTETVQGPKTFTGRHFWGRVEGSFVEPLVGDEADEAARRLGLRPFPEDTTGTTVAVVAPDFGDRTDAEALRWIVDALVWNLWPKMLPEDDDVAPMRFTVRHDGAEVTVPRPSEVPHLRPFLRAHAVMLDNLKCRTVEHKGLKTVLGRMGLEKTLAPPGAVPAAAQEAGLGERLHHTCLMRPVDLVVRYFEGPPAYDEHFAYAAVFRADVGADRVFAAAEPASHDDWLPEKLQADQRRLVDRAFAQIKEAMKEGASPRSAGQEGGDGVSLAAASQLFAGLMAGTPGQGGAAVFGTGGGDGPPGPAGGSGGIAGQPGGGTGTDGNGTGGTGPGSSGPTSGARGARLRYLEEPLHDAVDGEAVLVQRFELLDTGEQTVEARLGVALGDGSGTEGDPPLGASIPTVVGWRSETGELVPTEELHIQGGDGRIWSLVVRPAPDTITDVAVSSRRKEGAA